MHDEKTGKINTNSKLEKISRIAIFTEKPLPCESIYSSLFLPLAIL